MKKLRLVKVIVQPVIVADDGMSLEEVTVEPLTVMGSDWETFPTTKFAEAMKQLEEQVNEGLPK